MAEIEEISGRDCINPVKLANKINEIIKVLEDNEVLTKKHNILVFNSYRNCSTSKTQLKADKLRNANVDDIVWNKLSNRGVIIYYGGQDGTIE